MLKVKSTFIKIHGHGSILVTTFPGFEKQGGNLTVECVLRGLEYVLRNTSIKRVSNLYIQLDNVTTNKCKTLFAALALLVKLGTCRKVKMSCLEVGHTHEVCHYFFIFETYSVHECDSRISMV